MPQKSPHEDGQTRYRHTVVVVVVEVVVVVVVARDGSVEVVVMAMLVPLVVLEGRSDLHNRGGGEDCYRLM